MADDIEIDLATILGVVALPSTQQLTLYIPNKDRNGKRIRYLRNWLKEAQKVLTIIGGGSTTMPPADGTWLDPAVSVEGIKSISELKDKDVLWERTTVMYTYIYPDRFEENAGLLREFLHRFGRETNQGEVVFEFDGRFFRISEYDAK